jgi:hypothetical protein
VRENKKVEILSGISYLGFNASYSLKEEINIKVSEFQRLRGTIQRILR